jgi:hypothetical protein
MIPRLIGFPLSRPRRRGISRGRSFNPAPCLAIERLEERTLLSASLSLFNGSYAGTFHGTETVNNNGQTTKSTVTATAFQATMTNGVVALSFNGGTGSGIVNSNGQISGTVNTTVDGQAVPVSFTGSVTAANNSTTKIAGAWSYSANLGNGVTVAGQGSWTGSSPLVLTDFDGNYNGAYQGTEVVNDKGTKTTSAVSATAFQAVIANGTITDSFASNSGLTNGTGTISLQEQISGTASLVIDGVTVTVTDTGHASRSLAGVQGSGTWAFTGDLGGGIVETGHGTWTFQSVLVFDGNYTGSFNGSTVLNNNGTVTTTSIPNEVSDLSLSLTIANGAVTLSAPGVPATGTGTIDQNGNIIGSTSFTIDGVLVTGQFTGQVVATPNGDVITGAWNFSVNFGGGVVETGTGTWTAEAPPTLV